MGDNTTIDEGRTRGHGLSRRRLLATTGATAAGAALPSAAFAGRGRRRRTADVVVVGAGLAGLAAARELVAAGKDVAVLEARNRVGGRTHTIPLGRKDWIDVGGQWVGPTQDGILALAEEVGVKTFETYNSGDNIIWWEGEATRYAATDPVPPVPDGGDQALVMAVIELDSLAAELPPGEPWKWSRAAEFDGQTFETWKLATFGTRGGRVAMDVVIESVFACQPRDVSALFVLYYISQAGNSPGKGSLSRLISTAGGAQESRFVGGAEKVSRKLARKLGNRLVLGAPVRRIRRNRSGVRVIAKGIRVSARQAIVALPPTLAGRIDYDPPLPALRQQLTQRLPQGSAIKVNVVYPEPFWRAQGLSGQVVSDEGPIKFTLDNSPPDGSPGMLVGFLEGHDARLWGRRSAKARRQAVLESLARYFGPGAARPRKYVERNWSESPWTGGCYEGFTPPGVLLDYGEALRKPVGPIHWAGTETATRWIGYMDGAVESGQRAAQEVLERL